ncbi:hypothetical protein LPJ66_005213 [Kickxella alabastrina]|uniref:Uncharacterized protein n=1 Tax=Kickxella alabastrina TaxID=61397 RepID=A0ACC1IJH3_9FUNG|nr:hypothetical protein LPJ66_005213 [Kickxella alabastrina]
MDYFDLVATRSTEILSATAIESGLEEATRNLGRHIGSPQQAQQTHTLLDRFVYHETDRRTARAISLALNILVEFGRRIDNSEELASTKATEGLLGLACKMHQDATSTPKDEDAQKACEEALTCMANAMLLRPGCKAHFAKARGFALVTAILQCTALTSTATFLCARCLFLGLTTSNDAQHCVDDLNLQKELAAATNIYLDKERGLVQGTGGGSRCRDRFCPQQVIAELLKVAMSLCVLFQRSFVSEKTNVANDSLPTEHAAKFVELLSVCLNTLREIPVSPSGHLADAQKQAISVALSFSTLHPKCIQDTWLPPNASPPTDEWVNVDRIYDIFEKLIDHAVAPNDKVADDLSGVANEYQTEIAPLALVLVRLMTEHIKVREHLLQRVYPQKGASDFTRLPEDRPGIAGRLVRLLRIPQGGMLPSAAGNFMLALLSHDVKQFVMAVGYGNAAGYMLAQGIEIPADILEQVNREVAEDVPVDPVTGRAFSQADADRELAAMTDEEKEREAERLFVLFERLNKTGVIQVQNPFKAAVESGRFEELSDEDSK